MLVRSNSENELNELLNKFFAEEEEYFSDDTGTGEGTPQYSQDWGGQSGSEEFKIHSNLNKENTSYLGEPPLTPMRPRQRFCVVQIKQDGFKTELEGLYQFLQDRFFKSQETLAKYSDQERRDLRLLVDLFLSNSSQVDVELYHDLATRIQELLTTTYKDYFPKDSTPCK
jgi:hypothetical protein